MLRRRAEQNRLDSSNIDSDDDEWHGSDESECAPTDDGEDSVMDSPINQDILHDVEGVTDFDEDDDLGDDDYDSANGDAAGDEDGHHDSEGQISDESTMVLNIGQYGSDTPVSDPYRAPPIHIYAVKRGTLMVSTRIGRYGSRPVLAVEWGD